VLPTYTWYAAQRRPHVRILDRDYLVFPNIIPTFRIDIGAMDDWVRCKSGRKRSAQILVKLLRMGEGGEHSYRVRSAQGDYRVPH